MTSQSQQQSDLQQCRAANSLNVDSVTDMLYHGFRDKQTRNKIRQLIQNEPAFDKTRRPFQSRNQRMTSSIYALRRLLELKHEQRWSREEYDEALDLIDDQTGITLHEIAFRPVIASQGSDEQQAYWLPKCDDHSILGCYAHRPDIRYYACTYADDQVWANRTELGHGSNVQKLETTATYVAKDDQFELNSPTLSSTKWWIGGLGVMATHAVVQAQLLIPDGSKMKPFGPHLFILQIRSADKHEPLPGLTIGEIGPKAHAGFASTDNGFMRFDKVRVPRSSMLSRFANVASEGKYTKPPHDKLSYGGMIYIRAQMISSLAWQLAKAATISTRYLHVRRQFSDDQRSKERQVMTYPSVYMRVLPALAKAYVFSIMGKDMAKLYSQMSAQLKTGDTNLLAETHAISSGLKSYVSTQVVDDVEVCRRACGGHGFMASAGIGTIYATNLPAVTYEGDNFILNQQVCRAGIKAFSSYSKDVNGFRRQVTPSTNYLLSLEPHSVNLETSSLESLSSALSRRAALAVKGLAIEAAKTKVWTDLSWRCASVARAITEAFIGERLLAALSDKQDGILAGLGKKESQAIEDVSALWLLTTLVAASADLAEFGVLKPGQLAELRKAEDNAAKRVLPHSIALTDAFAFSDFELNSSLGRADGRAYEDLFRRANETKDLNLGKEEYKKDIQVILKLASAGKPKL